MKKIFALALLSALVAPSAFATDGVQVSFSGSCAAGSFDAAGNDIEYFNLDLDLADGQTSKECVITTVIPGQRGLRVNVSDFKAEAEAINVEQGGVALLTVGHRFNGQSELVNRSTTKYDGPLVAAQTAVGFSACGESVTLRTKLTTKAIKSILLQDSATSNTVSYKIGHVPCH